MKKNKLRYINSIILIIASAILTLGLPYLVAIFILSYGSGIGGVHNGPLTGLIDSYDDFILTIPSFLMGVAIIIYALFIGRARKPRDYTRLKIGIIVVIGLINIAAAIAYFPYMAHMREIDQDERAAEKIVQNQKDLVRKDEQKAQQAYEAMAKAKGCNTAVDRGLTYLSERVEDYRWQVFATDSGRSTINGFIVQSQNSLVDCANGTITPQQQQAILQQIPEQIVAEYKKLFSAAQFQSAEQKYKQKQAAHPEWKVY